MGGRDRLDVVCVGGCHRDVVARTASSFEPGTSCPGMVLEREGGVARNVAVLLAGSGLSVGLVGRVGYDAAGEALLRSLHASPLAHVDVAQDAEARTGTYCAIHDQRGEMVAAVSDLGVYDRIAPSDLAASGAIARAEFVFADANLRPDCLVGLSDRFGSRLAVDAISRAKATRLAALAGAPGLVFLNLPSAAALAGENFETTALAAQALIERGFGRFVLTGGAQPVVAVDAGRLTISAVPPAPVVDVTGAGDALAAAILTGVIRGRTIADAIPFGIVAAAAALSVAGALDRLPPEAICPAGVTDRAAAPAWTRS